MPENPLLQRIRGNPDSFGGKPIIRGLRISAELTFGLLAQGESPEAALGDCPDLHQADNHACLSCTDAAHIHVRHVS